MKKRKRGGELRWLPPQEDYGQLAAFCPVSPSPPPPLVLRVPPPQVLFPVPASFPLTTILPTAPRTRTALRWCFRAVCLLTGGSCNPPNLLVLRGHTSSPLWPKLWLFPTAKGDLFTRSQTASPWREKIAAAPLLNLLRILWRNRGCFQKTRHFLRGDRCGGGLETQLRWEQ